MRIPKFHNFGHDIDRTGKCAHPTDGISRT